MNVLFKILLSLRIIIDNFVKKKNLQNIDT
jgi:hypothetical protein